MLALLAGLWPDDPTRWDWQPDLIRSEPWRVFTAAWVHFSALHLAANLAGCALVAALGWVGRLTPRITLAWALAWPLTHLGLWLKPELLNYGGLSGVLHAGVACGAVAIAVQAQGVRRAIAVALWLGAAAKVLSESPWGPVLRQVQGWDISIAPLAHATGFAAGTVCAGIAVLSSRRQTRHNHAE